MKPIFLICGFFVVVSLLFCACKSTGGSINSRTEINSDAVSATDHKDGSSSVNSNINNGTSNNSAVIKDGDEEFVISVEVSSPTSSNVTSSTGNNSSHTTSGSGSGNNVNNNSGWTSDYFIH